MDYTLNITKNLKTPKTSYCGITIATSDIAFGFPVFNGRIPYIFNFMKKSLSHFIRENC